MIEFSKQFSLNRNDFLKALEMVVFIACITPIYTMIMQPGFDVFAIDWSALLHTEINASIIGVAAYLLKNYTSDVNGIPFGGARYTE